MKINWIGLLNSSLCVLYYIHLSPYIRMYFETFSLDVITMRVKIS